MSWHRLQKVLAAVRRIGRILAAAAYRLQPANPSLAPKPLIKICWEDSLGPGALHFEKAERDKDFAEFFNGARGRMIATSCPRCAGGDGSALLLPFPVRVHR